MTDWQITAKTIYCDVVDDEVTLLVYRDGSARCTGFTKYNQPDEITRSLIKRKSRRLKRAIKCEKELCPSVEQYREKILAEEVK